MIRTATTYDIPTLKKIWDESFSDPINYVDFIFDRLAKPSDAIVYEDGGRVVSMLLMIDTKFVYSGQSVDAVYILGAATLTQYQNRGIMTYLLDHAESTARQAGAQLAILVPGEQYLYSFYKRRGYSSDFSVRLIKLKPGMLDSIPGLDEPVVIDRISPSFIHSVREEALRELPHVQWDVDRIKTAMEDSLVYGDHIAAYNGALGRAYAFYSIGKKKLFIKECLGSSETAQLALVKEIISENQSRSVQMTLPLRSAIFEHEGGVVPYGMAKPLQVKSYLRDMKPYMNLMFD